MAALVALLASMDGGVVLTTATDPKKRVPVIAPPTPVLRAPPLPVLPPAPPDHFNPYPQPRGNRAAWVTTDDYPSSALRDELEGLVEVELSVATTGRAAACGIRQSPNVPALDEQTCRTLIRRARFNPATDANGRPVIGTFTTRIRWELPDDPVPRLPDGSAAPVVKRAPLTMRRFPLARPTVDLATLITDADHPDAALAVRRGGLVSVRVTIDASGAVAGCVPVWVYLDPDLSQKACVLFTERARFDAAVGEDGAPVSSALFVSHYWVPFPSTLPVSPQPPVTMQPAIAVPPIAPDRSSPVRPESATHQRAWITTDDYPLSAYARQAEGRVRARLSISEQGRVTGCTIFESSGHADLDAAVCPLLSARARFQPARDGQGVPITSVYIAPINWRYVATLPPPGFQSPGG